MFKKSILSDKTSTVKWEVNLSIFHRHGWYKNVEKHQGTYKVNRIVVSYPWVCVYCHSRVSQSNLPPLWGCTASFNPNDS